ncbi:hypothetical protein BCR35DRAFT_310830 [Leucosporidium creatinivorum]|uniref:Uncharacterized protein n=1 Tax=Leucosporidium creatinivorum TaxID=106004 RepID=A0A1Y2CP62_9BASI|nr:hypothetical protein BCR35DRAFT_310830 [Leucosporidium creatinivorum]
MPDELARIGIRPTVAQTPAAGVLQPTTPAKRSTVDLDPPSPKRQRTEPAPVELTTDGLNAAAVTRVLLTAVGKHPETREIIELHRPTILAGLSEDGSRKALLAIAQIYNDVLQEIGVVREQENAQVQRFEQDVAGAIRLLHSLDRLRPSQQYERSHEIQHPLNETLEDISSRLSRFSSLASKFNALAALSRIGLAIFYDADGEIRKALIGYGGSTGPLAESVISVLELLEGDDKVAGMEDARSLSDALADYGYSELQDYMDEAEAEL